MSSFFLGSIFQTQSRRVPQRGGMAWPVAWLFAALLLLASSTAWAQASAANKAAAEALFEQGRSLAEAGRYDEACAKFEASQQLDAGLGTLLHLADCYEKAGKLASSWATFEEAASLARARGESQRVEIAQTRATALEPQLIRVVIKAPTPRPEGFSVERNGTQIPAAAFNAPVPVDPGVWLIRAAAPDHQPFEISLTLNPGDVGPHVIEIPPLVQSTQTLDTTPSPAPSEQPAQPPILDETEADKGGASQKTLGLIIGSAGVVAVVVGSIFAIMANSANDNSKDNCSSDDSNACTAQGVRDREDAQTNASVATVANIIGVAAIAGGATLVLTAPDDESNEPLSGAVLQLRGTW